MMTTMSGRLAVTTTRLGTRATITPFHRHISHLPPTYADVTSFRGLDNSVACQGTTHITASLEDYDNDDESESDSDVFLQSTGARSLRHPGGKSSAEDYDIEEDWSSLGSRVVSTTGLAKASSPQVGSGQQAAKLMRPPSNPKIDRMRRDTYQPQERRLFRQDEQANTRGGGAAAVPDTQQAAEASRRQLQQLPDLQFGKKAALPEPSASGSNGSHARGLGRRDDSADQEEERLERALREAWRRSKQENAEGKPQLQRPGQAVPQGNGDTKASSSGRSVRKGNATGDIPVFGLTQRREEKPSSRPVAVPSPGSSNSSVLLTIASAMAADKREEEALSAIEDEIASLAQRVSGPAQTQQTSGLLKPRPTPPASIPRASIAGSRQLFSPPPPPAPVLRQQQQYGSVEEEGPSTFQQALRSAVDRSTPQAQTPARPALPTKPQPTSKREKQRQVRSEEGPDSDTDLGAFTQAIRLAMTSGTQDKQRLNRPPSRQGYD